MYIHTGMHTHNTHRVQPYTTMYTGTRTLHYTKLHYTTLQTPHMHTLYYAHTHMHTTHTQHTTHTTLHRDTHTQTAGVTALLVAMYISCVILECWSDVMVGLRWLGMVGAKQETYYTTYTQYTLTFRARH